MNALRRLRVVSVLLLSMTVIFLSVRQTVANPVASIRQPQGIGLAVRDITFFETGDFQTELWVKFYVFGYFDINKTFCELQPRMSVYVDGIYGDDIMFKNVTSASSSWCNWVGDENSTAFYAAILEGLSFFAPFNVYKFNITLVGDPNIAYLSSYSLVQSSVDVPTSHNYEITTEQFRNSTTITGQTVFIYIVSFQFPLGEKIAWIINAVVYSGAFIGGIATILSLFKHWKKRRKADDVNRFLGWGY